jgi:transcriptional regulator with XRE-family HTH domain
VTDQASEDQSAWAAAAPADFGAELRNAREHAGLSLHAIADRTKLPITALKALEANRIQQLPGGLYRRSILRAYAAEVGLDPQHVVRVFLNLYPDEVQPAVASDPVPASQVPRLLRAALSLAGALVPILAGMFYFASSTAGSDSPQQIVDVMAARSTDGSPESSRAPGGDALPMMISVSSQTRLAVIADGREVVARQLEPGEVIRLTLADDVVLMGDNAGAVQFSINGRAGRTLGEDGVPLSARIPRSDYLSWLTQQ